MTDYSELVKRLHADTPFKICPYDKRSPEYWTTPDNEPCKYCGILPEGPDKCTGGDTRIISEAADAITTLTARVAELEEVLAFIDDAVSWEINPSNYDHQQVCEMNAKWVQIGNASSAARKGGDA